jgi:Fibronectin type III domain.
VNTKPILPPTPQNIVAAATTTTVRVTWDTMENVTEYEIDVDGQTISCGTGNLYIHTGLTPNTTHTYRVRARNASGTGAWSSVTEMVTKVSTETYTLDCADDEVFDLLVTSQDMETASSVTFTITYDPDELEVVDLCSLTPRLDTATGYIPGTDIMVKQISPGTIVFEKTGTATSGSWSGIVNSITFKSLISGQVDVTYGID